MAVLRGDRVRVPAWPGVWKVLRTWDTNTREGFMADLERVDEPAPGDQCPSRRGSALVADLERLGAD
jgi:hypothetical protein